jgi:hypothetical protein
MSGSPSAQHLRVGKISLVSSHSVSIYGRRCSVISPLPILRTIWLAVEPETGGQENADNHKAQF